MNNINSLHVSKNNSLLKKREAPVESDLTATIAQQSLEQIPNKREKMEFKPFFGNEINGMSPQSCYEKINAASKEMGLKVNIDQRTQNVEYSVQNLKLMHPLDTKRDRYDNITPLREGAAEYVTAAGKTKVLNANRLSFKDSAGKTVFTGFMRSQAPKAIKNFYSWLLKEGEVRKPYILNLVPEREQSNPDKFNKYYPKSENETLPFNAKNHGYNTFVKTNSVDYDPSNQTMIREIEVTKGEMKTNITVNNYLNWEDSNVIELINLDKIVDGLIEQKNKDRGPIIIHCSAGVGRTGTVVASTIVKQALQGSVNLDINMGNYKQVISNLVLDLRRGGGGAIFVQTDGQLNLIFEYAKSLLSRQK